jgi:hypothetical protein
MDATKNQFYIHAPDNMGPALMGFDDSKPIRQESYRVARIRENAARGWLTTNGWTRVCGELGRDGQFLGDLYEHRQHDFMVRVIRRKYSNEKLCTVCRYVDGLVRVLKLKNKNGHAGREMQFHNVKDAIQAAVLHLGESARWRLPDRKRMKAVRNPYNEKGWSRVAVRPDPDISERSFYSRRSPQKGRKLKHKLKCDAAFQTDLVAREDTFVKELHKLEALGGVQKSMNEVRWLYSNKWVIAMPNGVALMWLIGGDKYERATKCNVYLLHWPASLKYGCPAYIGGAKGRKLGYSSFLAAWKKAKKIPNLVDYNPNLG